MACACASYVSARHPRKREKELPREHVARSLYRENELAREQAHADRAVLTRVEDDGDARVEAVGDQVLKVKRSKSGERT